MITITLDVDPVPWAAPKLSRYHTYDPKQAEKRAIRYLIKQQYDGDPIENYTELYFTFIYKTPKSATKKQRFLMLNRLIIPTKADCTNLQKLYEDCLKGIVIKDDRYVKSICSEKHYGLKGKVIICISDAGQCIL